MAELVLNDLRCPELGPDRIGLMFKELLRLRSDELSAEVVFDDDLCLPVWDGDGIGRAFFVTFVLFVPCGDRGERTEFCIGRERVDDRGLWEAENLLASRVRGRGLDCADMLLA